jgi:hypothetical protein
MTENLDHSRDGSSAPGLPVLSDKPSSSSNALARRRKFLAGGLATSSFVATLASRPALADTVCTISGFHSLNPSKADEAFLKCGDSPGCWKGQNLNIWASSFKKRDGTFTIYQQSTIIGSVTGLNSNPGGLANPIWTNATSVTLLDMINHSTQLTLQFAGTSTVINPLSNGQEADLAAALLNQTFFGTDAVGFDALTLIGNAISQANTAAADTTKTTGQRTTTIQGIFSTLDGTIGQFPHELCGQSGLF